MMYIYVCTFFGFGEKVGLPIHRGVFNVGINLYPIKGER